MIKENKTTRSYKDLDDVFCDVGGLRWCNASRMDKNYALNYFLAILFDFLIPFFTALTFSWLSISGYFPFIVVPPLQWLYGSFELLFAFIILAIVNGILAVIMIHRLGTLAFIPIIISVASVFFIFIPVWGEIVTYVIAVIPWWLIFTTTHLVIFQFSREGGEL